MLLTDAVFENKADKEAVAYCKVSFGAAMVIIFDIMWEKPCII